MMDIRVNAICKIKQLKFGDNYPSGLSTEMIRLSGKIVQIKSVITAGKSYRIDIDEGRWTWDNEMFEPITKDDLPLIFNNDVFGRMTLIDLTKDPDYPLDFQLEDGDIISLTVDFKWFKDKKPIKAILAQ